MARNTAGALLLSVLALALAACSSDGSNKAALVNANAYPTNYKGAIVATLRELFKKNETVSVSGALISPPVLSQVGKNQLYTLCVTYTAHGVSPGLVGNATRRAYFYGGQLNQLIPVKDNECQGVAYQPFTELDKVCVGEGCKGQSSGGGGQGGFMGLF